MDKEKDWLAEQFEGHRPRLWAVAYRLLGSPSEAEDAVQEAWLRLSCSNSGAVKNLGGWLTTVVARLSLDMLRSRKARREEHLSAPLPEPVSRGGGADPEYEMALADSVGLALLVVLERLAPAERIAFVLHDLFGLPFEEVARVVDRSPAAARQLASRARRRVRGPAAVADPDLARKRKVVAAFMEAARGGDFDALLAVLDPDVVLRADGAAAADGKPREVRGAANVAKGAMGFSGRSRFSRPALVDGSVGIIVAPFGRLVVALNFTITQDKIIGIDVIAAPEHLRRLDLAVLCEGEVGE